MGQYTLSGTWGGGMPCEPHAGLNERSADTFGTTKTRRTEGCETGRPAKLGDVGALTGGANWFTGSILAGTRPGESGKPW